MRKYLNYLVFGAIVLLVVGLAISHSRHTRALVDALAQGTPEQRKAAADELIKGEAFGDSLTGEPVETRRQAAIALADLGNVDAIKQTVALLKDADKPVRDQAIKTLEQIGAANPDNLKEMMNGLKDGDINVRKGTITALSSPSGGIGPRTSPDVVAAVLDIMTREDGARGPGGDVLSSPVFINGGANARSVPALLTMLDNKDNGVKRGAADALGKIGDPQAVAKLVTLMHDPQTDPAVRRVVIGAIALIASPSGEVALSEAVNNVNDDREARAQAAAGLGKIASPTAISTLIKALADTDLDLRSAAVAALGRAAEPPDKTAPAATGQTLKSAQLTDCGPASVAVQLTQALHDSNEAIRLGAAQALQTARSPEAVGPLVAVLTGDPQDSVRMAAAMALGFEGDSAAVTPLVHALSDRSGEVQTAAESALSRIGPSATEALIALTRQGGTDAYYAARALGQQGAQALPALEKAAEAAKTPVAQRWVAVALGETRLPEARTPLQQLAQSPDPDVAYVAHEQLNHLQ